MKAIQIKYMGSTTHRPSRVKAWTEAGTMVKSYDHGFSMAQQARTIAQEYCDKYGWGKVHGFGQLPNNTFVATLGA